MKYEYKIFNMSAVEKDKTWIEIFNEWGGEGWKLVMRFNNNSFIFMRQV